MSLFSILSLFSLGFPILQILLGIEQSAMTSWISKKNELRDKSVQKLTFFAGFFAEWLRKRHIMNKNSLNKKQTETIGRGK